MIRIVATIILAACDLLVVYAEGIHWDFRKDDDDYYTQPGLLFRLMGPEKQEILIANTTRAIGAAPRFIQIRHIGNCLKADPAYGEGVAKALGISMSEVPR